MIEEWRPAVGFPNYMVSDRGRVYSHLSQKFLCPGIASNGYPTVALGRGNTRTLHSLVAETFIGPCPEGQEVRHRDGVRTNPSLENLEYGTRSENIADAYIHGTRSKEQDRLAAQKCKYTRLKNNPNTYQAAARKGRETEIARHGPNARNVISKKTIATKDARYGRENWTALQRAGVAYSKKGGTTA